MGPGFDSGTFILKNKPDDRQVHCAIPEIISTSQVPIYCNKNLFTFDYNLQRSIDFFNCVLYVCNKIVKLGLKSIPK